MEGEPTPTNQEHEARPTPPRIYVASLSDYNNGALHGTWIDATQDADDIHAEIGEMLAASRMSNAEEYAIHDHEGFASFPLGEYETIDTVTRVAQGITEHGPAYAHWAQIVGTQDTERLDQFDQHYLGTWPTMADYAEDLLEDMGITSESICASWLSSYVKIDYEGLGRDLGTELDVAIDRAVDIVHVFEPPWPA